VAAYNQVDRPTSDIVLSTNWGDGSDLTAVKICSTSLWKQSKLREHLIIRLLLEFHRLLLYGLLTTNIWPHSAKLSTLESSITFCVCSSLPASAAKASVTLPAAACWWMESSEQYWLLCLYRSTNGQLMTTMSIEHRYGTYPATPDQARPA